MTEQEVNQIYDYLHEYFEYKNGEFIRKKKSSRGSAIGTRLGFLCSSPLGRPTMFAEFSVNKRRYRKNLSLLVWIYHNKEFAPCIGHKDLNPLNCSIENLFITNRSSKTRLSKLDNIIQEPKGYRPIKLKNGNTAYKVYLTDRGKPNHIGQFSSEKEAQEVANIIRVARLKNPMVTFEELKKLTASKIEEFFLKSDKNIFYIAKRKKYQVYLTFHHKQIYVGVYSSFEEAKKARNTLFLKLKDEHEKTKTLPSKSSK